MSGFNKPIIFITDQTKVDALEVCKTLPANSYVILRDYDLKDREVFAKQIQKLCRKHKLKFLVAKTPALAHKLKADGVHFPEFMHNEIRIWKYKKPNWIITTSVHSNKAARQIQGADYYLLSAIFSTSSHPREKPLGTLKARHIILHNCNKSYAALGGINAKTTKKLKNVGFSAFAGISGITSCGYNATKLL